MTSTTAPYSIVQYRGQRNGYQCGYCHSSSSKSSTGMWSHNLTVTDYQDLIDRGWRRSGKYVYKPTMNETCCPQYVIRCAAKDFRLNKSHKKIIKRNHKYFIRDVRPSATDNDPDQVMSDSTASHCGPGQSEIKDSGVMESQPAGASLEHESVNSGTNLSAERSETMDCSQGDKGAEQKSSCGDSSGGKTKTKTVKPGTGPDPNKPPCQKAKQKRLERKQQKQSQKTSTDGVSSKEKIFQSEPKSLEDHFNTLGPTDLHKLEVRLVRSSPRSRLFQESFQESYAVYKRYQIVVHKDPPEKPTERQYTGFLVDSPLEAEDEENTVSGGFGSFHQQYLLDGKIIAVGVMDILPRCVSSVYLYYDPDYSFLSLGTYTALRELAFVRELHTVQPSVEYYYMGFYIHSCPKMKYKGQFSPSFLVCPETYHWLPIEQCRPKLDAAKYSRLAPDDKEDEEGDVDVNEVLCLHQRQPMPYMIYKALNPSARDTAQVKQYASLVGTKCAKRMLLYRTSVNRDSDSN